MTDVLLKTTAKFACMLPAMGGNIWRWVLRAFPWTIHISSRFWLLKQLKNAYCYVYVFIRTLLCFYRYFYEMTYLDSLTVGHDTVGLSPLETNAQDIRRVSPIIVMNTVTKKYQLYTFLRELPFMYMLCCLENHIRRPCSVAMSWNVEVIILSDVCHRMPVCKKMYDCVPGACLPGYLTWVPVLNKISLWFLDVMPSKVYLHNYNENACEWSDTSLYRSRFEQMCILLSKLELHGCMSAVWWAARISIEDTYICSLFALILYYFIPHA